jgi:hypothetical protein
VVGFFFSVDRTRQDGICTGGRRLKKGDYLVPQKKRENEEKEKYQRECSRTVSEWMSQTEHSHQVGYLVADE